MLPSPTRAFDLCLPSDGVQLAKFNFNNDAFTAKQYGGPAKVGVPPSLAAQGLRRKSSRLGASRVRPNPLQAQMEPWIY